MLISDMLLDGSWGHDKTSYLRRRSIGAGFRPRPLISHTEIELDFYSARRIGRLRHPDPAHERLESI
jgi:hypothetical protein